MTKERRLAIEMWTNIRNMLSASDGQLPRNIFSYKEMFCADHDLKWPGNCWFCQYISACDKCPLKDCGIGSLYVIVLDRAKDKKVRIDVCNAIIKALGGEA